MVAIIKNFIDSRLVFPDSFAENAKTFCGMKVIIVAVMYPAKTLH
jgi:hypothetical protein